jgi:hypothetical protein
VSASERNGTAPRARLALLLERLDRPPAQKAELTVAIAEVLESPEAADYKGRSKPAASHDSSPVTVVWPR